MAEEGMKQPEEMFVSAAKSTGDLAGVFELDDDTGYFYLYDRSSLTGPKVIGAIHITSGEPGFSEPDLEIRWSGDERTVGLFIRGELWAAFREGERFGGNYRVGGQPAIPESLGTSFGPVPS